MPTPPRLGADALASELAKLPSISTSSPVQLGPVRLAITRAIASGQDASQLARDLSTPAGWRSIDLSKPPITAKPSANAASQPAATAQLLTAPSVATAAKPPDWAATVIPVALAKQVSSRVAVLDREPTALGGLELPAWARALSPAATYGPVVVSNPVLQITTTKWIQVFIFIEAVQFVRGTTVLCVLPLSIFDTGSSTHATIFAGSVWLAAQPFAATAPADGFAGIAIQSGSLDCDQPLTFGSILCLSRPLSTLTSRAVSHDSSLTACDEQSNEHALTLVASIRPESRCEIPQLRTDYCGYGKVLCH